MVFKGEITDAYGHKKLGGIGEIVGDRIRDLSAKFNNGRKIDVINQKLGYLVRCGDPDAINSIAPMPYANLPLDLLLKNISAPPFVPHTAHYHTIPLATLT